MQTYILRRILLLIPTLIIVTFLVFSIVRFIPGNVVDNMIGMMQSGGGVGPEMDVEEIRREIEKRLGLDKPFYIQYGLWMSGVLRGDFGGSLYTGLSVTGKLLAFLPVSLECGLFALLISLSIALPVGIISGMRPDTMTDNLLRSISILFICVPNFWIGTMIVVFPAVWWYWSPQLVYIPFHKDPWGNLSLILLPAFILGMELSGMTMRFTRNMMLEVLRQDYIRTAWAKGLRERVVILGHVLKNSLIPVATLVGLQLPVLVGAAIVVEMIFNLPGLGKLMINAIELRDYPIISAINVVMAVIVLFSNLLVDISYAWLDPRIRYR